MSTITLPNIRVSSDLTVRVRLKDGGLAIDWSTLNNVKASIYSDAQRALAGRCAVSIDAEDPTLLVCQYAANKPQYVGVNRIVVSAKYHGETKTYDKPAFSFVRWTGDQAGEQITIDDPDVDVEIDVADVSSSLLDEAIRAAFTAAEEAVDAKGQVLETEAEVEAAEALRVSAEESRVEAEEGRAEAEAARVDEEAVRVSAEDARVVAENARAAAEDLREGAEDDRAAAETARETAEAARVAAEALRVTAEGSRETAEAAREAQASADHTTAASDHTQAGADHTLAAADHVTAGEDHAQAQDDHEVMEGYDTRLGSVESEVSQLEAEVSNLSGILVGRTSQHFKSGVDGVSFDLFFDTPADSFILRVNQIVGSTTKFLIQQIDANDTASTYDANQPLDTDIQITINKATYPRMRVYAGSSYGEPTYTQDETDFELVLDTSVGLVARVQELEQKVQTIPTVADDLETNDPTKALSAKQGVVLDGKINEVALDLKTDVDGAYEERHFKTESDGVSIIQDFDTPASNFILRVNEIVGSTTKYLLQRLDTGGTASNYQTDIQFDTDLPITIDPATYPKMKVYAGSSYGTPTYPQEQTDFLLQVKTTTPGVRELAEQGVAHIGKMDGTHIKKEFDATQGSPISLARTTFAVDFSIGDIIKVSLITDCVADVAFYCREKGGSSLSQDGSLTANGNPRYIQLTKNIDQIAIYRSGGSVTQSGVVQLFIDKVGELDRANPLRGKRVVMFGDSITQLPCTGNTRGLGIPEFFEELTGAKVYRIAIGGTKLTRSVAELPESVTDAASASACYQICSLIEGAVSGNTTRQAAAINGYISDSFTKDVTLPILQNIDLDDIDIVTIFGGTNDCSSGISLGQKTDTDPTTIYGAVNYITKILLQRNPKLKVFFFTPIVRFFAEDNVSSWSDEYTPNQAGLYLYEYAEQIVESAVANHIRVCDLYNGMGWTKYNFVNFCSTTDWTHPRAGFDVIAEKMANFIKANL